jgi:hypothetical protein
MRSAKILVLGLCLAIPASLAGQGDLDASRRSHAAARATLDALLAIRDSALTWAEVRYRAIPDARRRGGGDLREALRAAQVAADSLAVLDVRLAGAVAREKQTRETLVSALETELEAILTRAESEGDQQAKAQLLDRARGLAVEYASMQEPLELPAADLPQVSVRAGDGPEEIELKADFLADRAAQLRSAADVIADELDRRLKRAELQAEMQRLMAEVHLFDLARVPPAGTQAPAVERSPLGESGNQAGSAASPDAVLDGDRDVESSPVAPLGDRGVDLPGVDVDGNDRRPINATTRLRRLREELLRRAAALERRAVQVRAMLREPSP